MKSDEANRQITTAMIEALERGVVPWHCPWKSGAPTSLFSGKPYKGINVLILGLTAIVKGYTSQYWGTFDRIAELAGCEKVWRNPEDPSKGFYWRSPDGKARGIRKGEKSVLVYFWEHRTKPDPDDPDNRDSDIHYTYTTYKVVFNLDQADFPDGLPGKYTTIREIGELPDAEKVFAGYLHRENINLKLGRVAAYDPDPDDMILPPRGMFESAEKYYSTALHECTHSTGHKFRLDRPGIRNFNHFGSGQYAKEELVAEMGAAMLCRMLGVEGVFDNSAAYIAGWLEKLKGEPGLIRAAAGEAQKAVDLIMNTDTEEEE